MSPLHVFIRKICWWNLGLKRSQSALVGVIFKKARCCSSRTFEETLSLASWSGPKDPLRSFNKNLIFASLTATLRRKWNLQSEPPNADCSEIEWWEEVRSFKIRHFSIQSHHKTNHLRYCTKYHNGSRERSQAVELNKTRRNFDWRISFNLQKQSNLDINM